MKPYHKDWERGLIFQMLSLPYHQPQKQGNLASPMEQIKSPETNPKEMETHELPIREVKIVVLRMLSE